MILLTGGPGAAQNEGAPKPGYMGPPAQLKYSRKAYVRYLR